MAQHSRKGARFQAVTANRLSDGIVVYLNGESWVESFRDVEIADGKEAAEALIERAENLIAKNNDVVEAYLFEVLEDGDFYRTASVRETIRQAGPTVRPDLGKQAELRDAATVDA